MNLVPSRTSTSLRMRRYSRRRRCCLRPTRLEGFDVGQGGAVEDGDFEVVELDDDVVDAEADERGEQVFGGGDEDALAHEAGGVGDLGDVAAVGGDLEVVEVGAAEDDAGAGGRGHRGAWARRRRECRPTPRNSISDRMVCSNERFEPRAECSSRTCSEVKVTAGQRCASVAEMHTGCRAGLSGLATGQRFGTGDACGSDACRLSGCDTG